MKLNKEEIGKLINTLQDVFNSLEENQSYDFTTHLLIDLKPKKMGGDDIPPFFYIHKATTEEEAETIRNYVNSRLNDVETEVYIDIDAWDIRDAYAYYAGIKDGIYYDGVPERPENQIVLNIKSLI